MIDRPACATTKSHQTCFISLMKARSSSLARRARAIDAVSFRVVARAPLRDRGDEAAAQGRAAPASQALVFAGVCVGLAIAAAPLALKSVRQREQSVAEMRDAQYAGEGRREGRQAQGQAEGGAVVREARRLEGVGGGRGGAGRAPDEGVDATAKSSPHTTA